MDHSRRDRRSSLRVSHAGRRAFVQTLGLASWSSFGGVHSTSTRNRHDGTSKTASRSREGFDFRTCGEKSVKKALTVVELRRKNRLPMRRKTTCKSAPRKPTKKSAKKLTTRGKGSSSREVPACQRPSFWVGRDANFFNDREKNVVCVNEAIRILSDCGCDHCMFDVTEIIRQALSKTGKPGSAIALGEVLHLLCAARRFTLAKTLAETLMPGNHGPAVQQIEAARSQMLCVN